MCLCVRSEKEFLCKSKMIKSRVSKNANAIYKCVGVLMVYFNG